MLSILLYGKLREIIGSTEVTNIPRIEVPYIPGESLEKCLLRVGIVPDITGDLFINHRLADLKELIPYDNSRIGVFPKIMQLLDGGLYIRYCGYRSQDSKISS